MGPRVWVVTTDPEVARSAMDMRLWILAKLLAKFYRNFLFYVVITGF